MDRRRFLKASGALFGLPALGACHVSDDSNEVAAPEPTPERTPEPATWVPNGPVDPAAFSTGIQVGDVTFDAAIVSAWTEGEVAELVVAEGVKENWYEVFREWVSIVDGGLRVEVTGLRPDTAHAAVLYAASGAARSDVVRFRTALTPGLLRTLTLGASSCFGRFNPDCTNVGRVAASDPDVFLLLGDSVYADGSVTRADYREYWRDFLERPSSRILFDRCSVIATWDDHEVANNWILGEDSSQPDRLGPEQIAEATAAFREALPQRVGMDGKGLWRVLSFGDVLDIIVLDARGERDGSRIVSDEQLAWAIQSIRSSKAVFKAVLSSVHLTDHTALLGPAAALDRWQGYPAQRAPLVEAIAATPGTFVISGDMHYGGLQLLDPPGGVGAEVWEVAVGPAGSMLFPIEDILKLRPERAPQYDVVVQRWTSSRFRLDPGLGSVRVEFVDDSGTVVAHKEWVFS